MVSSNHMEISQFCKFVFQIFGITLSMKILVATITVKQINYCMPCRSISVMKLQCLLSKILSFILYL